ncbi:MAG: HepT-like ribonuclease domain-containing protein [bacterium]
MSPRDWRVRLEDILEAIHNLQTYIQGMAFEEFAADTKTVRASAYEIGIIGEATRHIPDEARIRHPQVPWDKMQAIRNIVIHEYFRVDVAILWQTIIHDLPPLVPVLQEILRRER